MVSILKLFTIIDSNNHEMLSELIKKNKKVVSQCMIGRQSGTYILPRSVKVRAKECFDLLIDIIDPESFTLVTYNNETNTGLMQALKYYKSFPSQENKYYVERLLDINIPVALCEVLYVVEDTELFIRLFNRFTNKNELILKLIEAGNMTTIDYTLSWLISNEQLNENIRSNILKEVLDHVNLTALKLLDSKGFSLLSCRNIPSFYYVLNKRSKSIVRVEQILDYLLDYYKKQPNETIRQIPNINKIVSMIPSYYTNIINDTYRYEFIKFLKKAGIDTISINEVNTIYNSILSTSLNNFYYARRVKAEIVIIYSLLENGMMPTDIKNTIKYLKAEKLVYRPTNYDTYNSNEKEIHRGLYYVLSHFGAEIDLNDNDIKSVFDGISLEEFNIKKTESINSLLTELNLNKSVDKTPKKRTTKNKNITL